VATDADPLVAIQNAALERALLSETDSSEYVLLAGALERARLDDTDVAGAGRTLPAGTGADSGAAAPDEATHSGDTADATDSQGTGGVDAESASPTVLAGDAAIDSERVAGSLLTATLTATLAVRYGLAGGTPARPPSPSVAATSAGTADGTRRSRLLLEGALLAVERCDATTAEAAALAEVGVSAFERQIERRS
jgi:hypothetical protein